MNITTLWHLGQAAILGLVQGLTEFMPVSSSGHLIIAREFLKLDDPGNFFDAILHLATLLAVLIYFWRDWGQMFRAIQRLSSSKQVLTPNRRLLKLILWATLPGLAIGYLGNQWIENRFRSGLIVAILLMVTGAVYLVFERLIKVSKTSKPLTTWSTLSIGMAQALAIIPGISRSGMTILGGMYVGLTREAAVRFSFLLAAPIMIAAGGYGLYQTVRDRAISHDYWFWLVAFVVALLSGLGVIHWLLKFFQKHSLNSFAYYLLIAGSGLLIYGWIK